MAFKTELTVDGKTYSLLHCNYSIHREIQASGKPGSGIHGGTIQIEVESSEDTSMVEWMTDYTALKSGEIKFYKPDQESSLKTISFEDAVLTEYSESANKYGNNPMTENLIISARVLKIGSSAEVEQEWGS